MFNFELCKKQCVHTIYVFFFISFVWPNHKFSSLILYCFASFIDDLVEKKLLSKMNQKKKIKKLIKMHVSPISSYILNTINKYTYQRNAKYMYLDRFLEKFNQPE